MHSGTRFKRQTLALFFIVSLVPALLVTAVWYVLSIQMAAGQYQLVVSDLVLPVFFIGLLPAAILSFIFAELLTRPVREIHYTALELAKGNYAAAAHAGSHGGEFGEVTRALTAVSTQLERALSEAKSETEVLEAERNKLRGILNSMTDGVFALDRDGRIILFNKAASTITGRSITEVAGQLSEKVMPFRERGELVMTRWLADHHGAGQSVGQWRGLELYRADGTSLYVDVQAVALARDPNGISALITFHDLTADHQLEEMKVDFVALAAHELRTPLTEVRGYLDLLQHEAKLRKADRELVDRAMTGAGELVSLMNNLLGVARIEHGGVSYRPEALDYGVFLRKILDQYAPLLMHRDLRINLDVPADLPPLTADSAALREVINNLVSNALTHTPMTGGTVSITARRERRDIITTITDNGTGIPKASLPHLFTKFYRVNEYAAQTRGTGLGLYISRSIIEAHDGHIWVESEEGRGTTFGFNLPVRGVAKQASAGDNKDITRGTHGWIKEHPVS